MKYLPIAVALGVIHSALFTGGAQAQTLFALRPGGNSSLLHVDANGGGFNVTTVGSTGIQSLSGLDRQPSTGTIFGSTGFNDTGKIYTLNPTTGAGTLVGSSGFEAVSSLAFDLNGTLFGSGSIDPNSVTDRLITINPTTGAGTLVGLYNVPGISGIDGLAVHPANGTLYGVSVANDGTDPLFSINKSTGQATSVGILTEAGSGNASPQPIVGLTFDSLGNLYGSTGFGDGQIMSIDINNLTFTILGDAANGSVSDLLAITPVPEPATTWVALGLLSASVVLRRRMKSSEGVASHRRGDSSGER